MTQTPCMTHPEWFLQPGERDDWDLDDTTTAARNLCNSCPQLRECATDALTLGNLDGDPLPRIADGIIAAGVVCRGDAATLYRLRQISGTTGPRHLRLVTDDIDVPTTLAVADPLTWPQPDPEPATEGTHCAGPTCGKPFTDQTPRPEGHVTLAAHGLCRSCYTRARRISQDRPLRRVPSPECIDCKLPMVSRSRKGEDFGGRRVVFHAGGDRCATCHRRHRRLEQRTTAA